MPKSHDWFYTIRGKKWAYGCVRFLEPVAEREARKRIRQDNGYNKRLPNGTEVWPTSYQEV